MIGQAQTGTGKTAAFGLPLLEYLDPESRNTQALVLTPTRELCIQVTQALRAYAEHLPIEVIAVFGGQASPRSSPACGRRPRSWSATVGRTLDLVNRGSLDLSSARYVVLDEADEMLDLGFIDDVERILRMCPSGRQTSLFSATIPPPIERLADRYMYDPVTISVTPEAAHRRRDRAGFRGGSGARARSTGSSRSCEREEPEQAIIFCRTKLGTARLDDTLRARGLGVKALHGDMSQGQRDGVMLSFKDHRLRLLVATDVAARGLDIEHVTHVINYDVPDVSETYVHRIGRTGRVGRTGRAITFVTPAQRPEIDRIEREVKTSIGEWEPPEERLEHAPRPRRHQHGKPAEPKKRRRERLPEKADDDEAEQQEPRPSEAAGRESEEQEPRPDRDRRARRRESAAEEPASGTMALPTAGSTRYRPALRSYSSTAASAAASTRRTSAGR